ncbi:MAG: hypothetical protein QW404_00555 [Candidatus Nanoarchaeia archaeon]
MKSSSMDKLGVWSFLAGLVIVVIAAFIWPGTDKGWVIWLLGILGIIVGLINITGKEVMTYLVAAVTLIVGAGGFINLVDKLGMVAVETFLRALLNYVIAFVAPGAVIVAIKSIYGIAKEK